MKVRVLTCLILAFIASASVFSQEAKQDIFIKDFTYDPYDQSAKEYRKTDGSGNLYALIKVRPASDAFNFDFGYMKHIVDTTPHDDETWLYVQKNAKLISISRKGFKSIKNQDLGITLEAGCTYILELSYVNPSSFVRKQWLKFDVKPHEEQAVVMVKAQNAKDYEPWGSTNKGLLAKNVECGKYFYQIMADNYVTSDGVVHLDAPNTTHVETVNLVPNFGFLQIDNTYGITGAEVYVDNKKIGTVPLSGKQRLSIGEHTIMIMNGELFKPYTTTIQTEKGVTTTLAPQLESNTGNITLQVESDAEIYLDEKLLGKRKWTGSLKEGKYSVECRLLNHESTFKTITIVAKEAQVISLDNPKPITGYIAVNTFPLEAEVKIDGKIVGTTPMTTPPVLIGQHTLTLSLPNHKTEERTVTVEKDKTTDVDVTLSTIAKMQISSTPSGASLYLNGIYAGATPYSKEMASGDYDIKLVKKGFQTLTKKAHLDGSKPQQNFKLSRKYFNKSNIYLGATFSAPGLMAVGAHLGGYIYHVNIEADYKYGLSKSETIYWNNTSKYNYPKSEEITAQYAGGKIGYGFTFNTASLSRLK